MVHIGRTGVLPLAVETQALSGSLLTTTRYMDNAGSSAGISSSCGFLWKALPEVCQPVGTLADQESLGKAAS